MAVITASQKPSDSKRELTAKKHTKAHYKTRPITATLEHPLILDIKLLKKLDMTTFTKKSLIALSKFCGISLINKTETKKKLNKCARTIHYSKKVDGTDCPLGLISECRNHRTKRKLGKQLTKAKPRIRFKLPKEETSPDEDSLDVVCKNHNKMLKTCNKIKSSETKDKSPGRNSVLDSNLEGTIKNIVPEPCKTCSRSQHPERFHSHPKVVTRLSLEEQTSDKNLEERFKNVVTTKDENTKKSLCAKDSEGKSLQNHCTGGKPNSKSPSGPFIGLSSSETLKKLKLKAVRKPSTPSSSNTKSKGEIPKKANSKTGANQSEEARNAPSEEDLRFVTGCYVCGKQVSPKLRIQHEKSCILEWRTQNCLVSPDQRKPEPKRPDYRFTCSGAVDFEGTFESIWANHMESLVPCKKCGRKFFPDRIERHEDCCNNLPIIIKNKH